MSLQFFLSNGLVSLAPWQLSVMLLFLLQAYGIGNRPTDIYSNNPPLVLLLETSDAREQLVYLQHNLCKECPEFNQLVKVTEDCLNLDCQRRIIAPNMHDRLSILLKDSQ